MPFESMSSVLAARLLANAGFDVAPSEVEYERRGERWRVTFPGEHIAWVAASVEGRRHLSKERKLLRLIARNCEFRVPELIFEDSSNEFDVRTLVAGTVDPGIISTRQKDEVFLRRVGTDIGSMLAQQHTRIGYAEVGAWLPTEPGWPRSSEWIGARLPRVTDDADLLDSAHRILRRYEDVDVEDSDRVLVHGDVGFHNLAMDASSGHVNGLFDYGDAAWADRHHDFRYLDNGKLLQAALANYESATGHKIDRERITLYNAVCAISFLAFRDGIAPTQRWCGRTLAEDLEWTRGAIERCNSG